MKTIRLIELFSGYGSQKLALEHLGVAHESYAICEWNYKSFMAYDLLHCKRERERVGKELSKEQLVDYLFEKGISADWNKPMELSQLKRLPEEKLRDIYNSIYYTNNFVDVSKLHGKDLNLVDRDKYQYWLTYSFPCFTADSLVLTKTGYKKIVDICVGDCVLSHDNQYHKVLNKFNNGEHGIYKINAMGIDEIKTTYNHKFLVRTMYRKGRKNIRCFKTPEWKELKDLTKNDYLGIAINQESNEIISKTLPTLNTDFWWVIGRYLGDGWIRRQGGIIICCAKMEKQEIISKLTNLNFHYNIVEDKTVSKIHIPKKALSDFVEQFGSGAIGKHLTQDIIDLPIQYLKTFLEGYMSADGCFTNGLYKASSISRELIYGIAQCVAKVYKTPYRIYKVKTSRTKIIEGRLVNQNDWYQLVFKTEKRKHDKAFYEDNYIWYPIRTIKYVGEDYVYDIEVDSSHSFTIQNTIVHNCQDLSLAGKELGMAEDSGTRSSMIWQVARILRELKELKQLPDVLIMENVPQVHSKKNIDLFNKYLNILEELGYTNSWKDLNSKDYGIPQNRNRCFVVSKLYEYSLFCEPYQFPKGFPLGKKLKDILEKNVDEKYYLSNKNIESMKNWNAYQKPLEQMDKIEIQQYSPTITTRSCDNDAGIILIKQDKKCIDDTFIAAIRGRQDDNGEYKQQLEIGDSEASHTLTTIQKDNVIVTKNKTIEEDNIVKLQNNEGLSPTVTTTIENMGIASKEENQLRIRKLTPRECFRLMGLWEQDIDKIINELSESILYHLAGDSIVCRVLEYLFYNLFE